MSSALEHVMIVKDVSDIIAAVLIVGGVLFGVYKWVTRQNRQNDDIKYIVKEQECIVYGLQQCLDGLIQLGADHNVEQAKKDLEKHINEMAHKNQ